MPITVVRCASEKRAQFLADCLSHEVPSTISTANGCEIYTTATPNQVRYVIWSTY